jgi:hypothetical protein
MSSPRRDWNTPTWTEMAAGRPARTPKISARVKLAIEYMTHGVDGGSRVLTLVEAAAEAKITPAGLREQLKKPNVRALWAEQRDAAILALSASIPKRTHELMMQDENKVAAVNASRSLHNMVQDIVAPEKAMRGQTAGIVIVVGHQAQPAATVQLVEPRAAVSPEHQGALVPQENRRIAPADMAAAPRDRFIDGDDDAV